MESRGGVEDMEDLQMIDDRECHGRDQSVSRHRSLSRSVREVSPRVTLPPTPITNPEKFGIRVADKTKPSSSYRGSISSLISPTDSINSNDFHLDGMSDTSSAPMSPSRSSVTNSPSHGAKKGKGFMATMAGIFHSKSKTSKAKDEAAKEDNLVARTASLSLQAS